MELSELCTRIHVAELGRLSKPADRRRIALVIRHGRGLVLTDQGRDVLGYAACVMAEIEEIRARAADRDAGRLTGP